MVTFAPPKRRPILTDLDKEMLARLLKQSQTPIEAYTRESALGVPWGSLANSLIGGMLVRGERKRAENIEERRNEAMSKLLKLEGLPAAPVGSEEFVGGAYMRDGGDIVTNLAPVEDRSYGENLKASQEMGTVLRGTDGAQPNYFERKFGGALPEKRVLDRNQLISEAGYDPMEYNLYEQQVEAARPKPTVGKVEVFYNEDGEEFEGQTVTFVDGTVKVKRPDEAVETATYYNWDEITRTPPKEKDIQLIINDTTNEILAIDKNNIDGGYITMREGKVPKNIQQFGNAVVDTNQIGKDGQFKVLYNIPEDVKVKIQTFDLPGGITKTVARNELTGTILWQEEIEQETIKILQNGEILSMVGNKFTQLRAPEAKDKQTIEQPDGVYIWNAKDGTIGEKLFDKEPNITWKEVFDPELNKNMLYGIKDDGSVPYKFDAKKEDLKKSAREIKIQDYINMGFSDKKARKLVDNFIKIETDGGLFYVVDLATDPPTRKLIKNTDSLHPESDTEEVDTISLAEDVNKTQFNQKSKEGWLVPRVEHIEKSSGSELRKANILANTATRGMQDIAELYQILLKNPKYVGFLGKLNREVQGLSGYLMNPAIKYTYEKMMGVNLDDPAMQRAFRLMRNIDMAANDIASAKGFRQPSVTQLIHTEEKFDWDSFFVTGKSALPMLAAEFENMNNKYMIFQSMNPMNDKIENWMAKPDFSFITGDSGEQGNVVIKKRYDPDNDEFFGID
jgi:hypothetical protein